VKILANYFKIIYGIGKYKMFSPTTENHLLRLSPKAIFLSRKERCLEGIAIAGVRGLLSLLYFVLKVPDYPLSGAFVFFAPGLINHNQGAGASGVKNPFYAEDNR